MTKRTHVTVSGHRIDYEPTPKVAAFLRRLEDAIGDPKVTERELIGLAYSSENPFLDHGMFPGRGSVTKDVLADPAYHVMTDLLFRKQVAEQEIDVSKLEARYSMTVPQAAVELGIHESAVRQAIAAKRLASWLKDGKHFIDPRSLKSFEVGTRGPRKGTTIEVVVNDQIEITDKLSVEPLELVLGHTKGASLKVRGAEDVETIERVSGNIVRGRLNRWKRVIVMTTGDAGKRRAFVLEPGADENEITHGPFKVRGRFTIAEKINSAKRADEVWSAADVA